MGYSKRQFVSAAFEEIGLAAYAYDLQPDQIESALRRLDSMMAEWNAKGIRLGYPLPHSPEFSDINSESGVPDSANEAIITNLALRIAPGYGKSVATSTVIIAKNAYNVLMARAAMPSEVKIDSNLPAGAGHKRWTMGDPYIIGSPTGLAAGGDSEMNFN